jgi:hypothetical protein
MTVPFAVKGSQRWLQVAVENAPEAINAPLRAALGCAPDESVQWVSPRRAARFQEYRDDEVVRRCGFELPAGALSAFWPLRGPLWDGLATVGGRMILIEAKGHIPELVSTRTRAKGAALLQIRKSMREVQTALSPKSLDWVDWTGTFYQYGNRVAHLYFLRQHQIPAHLVNVYFLNAEDVRGPTDPLEWKGAVKVIRTYLGLGRHRLSRYMHDLYIDARPLAAVADTTS